MRNNALKPYLTTAWAGQCFLYEEETDSTNLMAKRLAKEGGSTRNTGVCCPPERREGEKREDVDFRGKRKHLHESFAAS